MCGIVGYTGHEPALSFLLKGLKRLEYRGYDSAGVAVLKDGEAWVCKREGTVEVLERALSGASVEGLTGIGHTRWATHGPPSDRNAHPHRGCDGEIAVIHNGVIENHSTLRRRLAERGHRFRSDTDTEVIPHLIEEHYEGRLLDAVMAAVRELRGSFAIIAVDAREPETLVAARKDSPLIVGLGEGENYLASDIPALLGETDRAYILEDGEVALLTPRKVEVFDWESGQRKEKQSISLDWEPELAERAGYRHFMLKEIHEQPRAVRDTLAGRVDAGRGDVSFEGVSLGEEELRRFERIFLVACGTAYHAGMVGRRLIETLARVPVETDLASEFRYRDPLIDDRALFVAVSQSGETADTLAALREARARGAHTLAVANVVGSSIAREAHDLIYTRAGPEIAVASTKAYVTQIVVLSLLAAWMGRRMGVLDHEGAREILSELEVLPEKIQRVLEDSGPVEEAARTVARHQSVFFIGRGLDHAIVLEGQLKLKEISYIHAEAYAAGELKHGTLALIEEGVPVVACITQDHLRDKILGNVMQVTARGGEVVAVAFEDDEEVTDHVGSVLRIPRTHELLTPALAAVPLQLLAYYAALERGCNIDKPRNLAKSVTVE